MESKIRCKPIFIGRQSIGDRFDDGRVFVFFGNRNFSTKEFERLFPHWTLRHLKQVHSPHTIGPIPDQDFSTTEGDALWTFETGLAVCVYTADCLPVLAHDPTLNRVLAIHAGWRGLAQDIIPQALSKFASKSRGPIRVWVGPHIQKQSFEVRSDALDLISKASGAEPSDWAPKPSEPGKFLVNLSKIAVRQVLAAGVAEENVWGHATDTFASQDHYSFRRDGPTGRLLNFIVLQSPT